MPVENQAQYFVLFSLSSLSVAKGGEEVVIKITFFLYSYHSEIQQHDQVPIRKK